MKVAVILSGCGVRDGSEIHEAVTALLSLDQRGHEYQCYAPDINQTSVVNHITGRSMDQTRSVLEESARIARGNIINLNNAQFDSFDAVVLPGGFGAAVNLCNFGSKGSACTVNNTIESFLTKAQLMGKPIGFMCIAPVIAARVFGNKRVRMTIGDDPGTAAACEAMGAVHVNCRADEACVDHDLKIVTTPAYMKAQSIAECYKSADALVAALEKLV